MLIYPKRTYENSERDTELGGKAVEAAKKNGKGDAPKADDFADDFGADAYAPDAGAAATKAVELVS